MSDTLQTSIVAIAVIAAAAFVLRKYVLKKKGASSGACGSCSNCGPSSKRCH